MSTSETKHSASEVYSAATTTKQSWLLFAVAAILLFLGVGLYWDGLAEAVLRWETQDEYSHGYLIPLVSLYIIWENRFKIRSSYTGPLWKGVAVMLMALPVYLIGEVSALYILIHYSFIAFLLGVSLAFIGRATRYTLLPIFLLCFAIPLPYFIEIMLTAKMQLISTELGVVMLRAFSIPVFMSGNIIDLGSYKLQVVEACSGLRYLFPLLSLGVIAAYFYRASNWKRIFLVVSTIPVTLIMNSLRIAITGLLMENFGMQAAEGFLHDFEGWIIFMACGAILVLEVILMEWWTKGKNLSDAFSPDLESLLPTNKWIKPDGGAHKPMLAAILLTIAFFVIKTSIDSRIELSPKSKALATFPEKIGDWSGHHTGLSREVVEKLGLSDYLMINYDSQDNKPVNFYVAHYASQRKGVSPHSPRVCIPGGGWEIASIERMIINDLPVNRVIIRKETSDQLVYYWFEERGIPVANEYVKKWMLLRDAFTLNRTDGALVRVTTPIFPNETLGEAESRIKAFIEVSRPKLKSYLPGQQLEDKE